MISEQLSIYNAAIAIKEYIDANPLSKDTPSDLAAKFKVERHKVLPVFKELTGDTIKHYQLKKLMNTASQMLLSGVQVKEVAIECGYSEYHNNFTRGFKKVFKIGPDEWLRMTLLEKK